MNAPVAIVCRKCGKPDTVSHHQAVVNQTIQCNACVAAYRKEYRQRRKAAGNPIGRRKDRAKEYEAERKKNPAVLARRAADMARYAKDPALRAKHEARWQVRRAIASGKLVRQPCEVCKAEPAHGHHDDYSKPLDVRWLCPAHHREHHARCKGEKA